MLRTLWKSLVLAGAMLLTSHAARADVVIPTVKHTTNEFLSSTFTFFTDANMYVLGNTSQPWFVGRGTTVAVPMGGGYTFVNTTVISYDNRTLYEIPAGTYMKVPYFAEEPSQPVYHSDEDQADDNHCSNYYYHNGSYYCRDNENDDNHHDDDQDSPGYAYASGYAYAGKDGVKVSSTAVVVGSGSASSSSSASSGSSSAFSWATAGGKK